MKTIIFLVSVFSLLNWWNNDLSKSLRRENTTDFDRCTVVNESTAAISKFEIDLSCCGIDGIYKNTHNSEIRNLLWLSIKSKSKNEITGGDYNFSSRRVDVRNPMTFTGGFIKNGKKTEIESGTLHIEIIGNKIKILYSLILLNGSEISGRFFGEYKQGKL